MSIGVLHARLTRLWHDQAGQTMVEYGGMILLVSIAAILLLWAVGLDLAEVFDTLENNLGDATDNTVPDPTGNSDQDPPTGVN